MAANIELTQKERAEAEAVRERLKTYDIRQVSLVLAVTPRTIQNYIKRGRLHGNKVGGRWRFSEDDIKAIFEPGKGV